jgi:pimeloyl-ACP methyl ester carboxylesterase
MLVMHAHGGPNLGIASYSTIGAELVRWRVMVSEGFAWAGSSYRVTGYGVRDAAEDTENLRQIFVDKFGQPVRTILHGQSWGGNVAAKVSELYSGNYDGMLLTSGVVGGGSRAYYFRLDLRAVYQFYCHNHPRADEPQYPLWMGLPGASTLTAAELMRRANECTGYQLPPGQRTPQQGENLANILNVVRIPERTFYSHLAWGTFHFQDLTQRFLGGIGNPFPNQDVLYTGATDSQALNAGIIRYRSDPEAVAQLAEDSDLSGETAIPTLSMHAIDDPTAFVEHESSYRNVREQAGTSDLLAQFFTDEHDHSVLSLSEYATVLHALVDWIETGEKPEDDALLASCERFRQRYRDLCYFVPDYQPAPFFSRTYPRNR